MKIVRRRYIELNDSFEGATNGLKQYVVIFSRLMFRSSRDKLQVVKDQPSFASTQQVQNADSSQSKKRSRRESCDSFAAVIAAVNYAAPLRISQIEISARNALVNIRLREDQLCVVDVCDDGNCFFCSLSVCMDATENNHSLLRKNIAQSMIDDCNKSLVQLCTDDRKRILQ